MRLRKHRSSLDVWLDRGGSPEKLWKLIFYFFSRFILVFCVLHYFGVAYPQMGWVFPGPTSYEFWACCVLFTVIFAVVFYMIRGKRRVSGDGSNKHNIKSSPVKGAEEKREGRYGGVGRATFEPQPESEEERSEHQRDRRQ
jgi:hypothetical protein